MNRSAVTRALLFAVLAIVAGVALWHHDRAIRAEARAALVTGVLQPVAAMLKENQALIKELQSGAFAEPELGILPSYLAKIRRDGLPRHADMKQRLDQLAENNSAITALVTAYTPQARTATFSAEAGKFRNYAAAWRDRWNSVMELFMQGGGYAASGAPFPNGFAAAVDTEIVAAGQN